MWAATLRSCIYIPTQLELIEIYPIFPEHIRNNIYDKLWLYEWRKNMKEVHKDYHEHCRYVESEEPHIEFSVLVSDAIVGNYNRYAHMNDITAAFNFRDLSSKGYTKNITTYIPADNASFTNASLPVNY
jgi:hypothetical protein